MNMQINSQLGQAESMSYKSRNKGAAPVSEVSFEEQMPHKENGSVLGYYRELCKAYPDITFRLEDRDKTMREGVSTGYEGSSQQQGSGYSMPGQCSIEIDSKVIEKMMKDQDYASKVKSKISSIRESYDQFEGWTRDSGYAYTDVKIFDDQKGLTYSIGSSNCPVNSAEDAKKFRESDSNVYAERLLRELDEIEETYFKMVEESRRKREELLNNLSGRLIEEENR